LRARDLGIGIGSLQHGEHDAITDVPGVRVGYTTLIEGDAVRTGVTVVLPPMGADGYFAGIHRLNGNGELTGVHFIEEMGALVSPVAITNTHSIGAVHEGLVRYGVRSGQLADSFTPWSLPVVAETWDGFLNDINGFHIRPEHVAQAVESAQDGAIEEGNVGGGTGMICHGFKGGTGTASRRLAPEAGGWVVGVLVQANHGRRTRLRVNGVPVGQEIGPDTVPLPEAPEAQGSIIVVVATSAPLVATQCTRLAQRAALGIGRTGGLGEDSSGDLILAFATGNALHAPEGEPGGRTTQIDMLWNSDMNPLFEAVVDATEEAIVNALLGAETMRGVDSHTAHALPPQMLLDVMHKYAQ
jgi:D-aminopeptidase